MPEGSYVFRTYTGYNEGYSESITITSSEAAEMPDVNVEVRVNYGYSTFKLKVLDEFKSPKPNVKVTFYKNALNT